jgi:hypothetical protein
MRAKELGETSASVDRRIVGRVRPGPSRGIIRLHPETWSLLAALRRPLLDSEGNLVGFESFDRLVRRILAERRDSHSPGSQLREASR